ncbi:MAG: hypothetical protein ACE10K_06410 [Rhodothermales bacterium]
MAECREHHFIMEALAPVRPINHLMADFPGRWGFCVGYRPVPRPAHQSA